jgi:hypothetical protein
MADSLSLATWFWLLVPAVLCLGFTVWRYQHQRSRNRHRRQGYRLESKTESRV